MFVLINSDPWHPGWQVSGNGCARQVLRKIFKLLYNLPIHRWGKHLLELGGNNALIVNNDADVKMVRMI